MVTKQHSSRVTGGEFRNRVIKQPGNGTRPVSSKTREAIFDVLGQDLSGLNVLDLYAGSGALGIEALSRGAAMAVFIDKSRAATECILQNLTAIEKETLVRQTEVTTFLREAEKFDLIFFDPPYNEFSVEIAESAAAQLAKNGVLIISCSSQSPLPEKLATVSMAKSRDYDDTKIAYYKR